MATATSPRHTHRRARRVLHLVAPTWRRALVEAAVLAALLLHLPPVAHLLCAIVVHLLVLLWP